MGGQIPFLMKDCLPLALLLAMIFGFAALASAQTTTTVITRNANTGITTVVRSTQTNLPALPTGSTHKFVAPEAPAPMINLDEAVSRGKAAHDMRQQFFATWKSSKLPTPGTLDD